MTTHELSIPQNREVSFWNSGSNWQWFVLICLIYAGSSFISQTFILSDSLFYNTYGEQMAYERIDAMLNFQAQWQWVGFLFIPLFIALKLLLVTLSLLGGCIWENYRIGFRQIWSMVLRAELVFAIAAVFTVLFLTWFVELQSLEDLQRFHNFSLMAFLPVGEDLSAWYLYPLQVLNIFEVLYWFVLIWGMLFVSKRSLQEMIGLVGSSYGLGLLLWVMLVIFLKLNMGL